MMQKRTLAEVARETRADWKSIGKSPADEYVAAMAELRHLDQNYYGDTAVSVVARFLGVCGTWGGPAARRVKEELRGMLRGHGQIGTIVSVCTN